MNSDVFLYNIEKGRIVKYYNKNEDNNHIDVVIKPLNVQILKK